MQNISAPLVPSSREKSTSQLGPSCHADKSIPLSVGYLLQSRERALKGSYSGHLTFIGALCRLRTLTPWLLSIDGFLDVHIAVQQFILNCDISTLPLQKFRTLAS